MIDFTKLLIHTFYFIFTRYFFFFQFEVPRDIVDDNGAAEENGTSEYRDEDGSTIHDVENDDDDYEDEDEEHLGEVSTVKKIFRFFTT